MIREKKLIKERRRTPRVKCDFTIEIESQKSSISAHAINISASGIYLECNHPIPLFREIGIGIRLPGVEELIECVGVVVRSEKAADKGVYNTAIFFEDMGEEDKDLLIKYVDKQIGS